MIRTALNYNLRCDPRTSWDSPVAVRLNDGFRTRKPFAASRGARPPVCTLHPVNGRVCVSEGVLRGFLMRFVAPELLKGANENGDVLLHLIVPQTGGKAVKISAVCGDPALTRSVVRAVRDWVFMPYPYKDKYVEMEGDVHIRFKSSK